MKRPNGVILDSPSILADCSSVVGKGPDVPPCKVNECGYFHRDCRDEVVHSPTAPERCLDGVALNVVNGIKDMLDDVAGHVGCDGGLRVEPSRDPTPPRSPVGSVEDEEMKQEVNNCLDKRIARLEPGDKRQKLMLSIDHVMRELRAHEAALILLKRMRLSQIVFNWRGKPIGEDSAHAQSSKPSGIRCFPVPSFFDASSADNAAADPRYSVRARKGDSKSRGANGGHPGVRRCDVVNAQVNESPRWRAEDNQQISEMHPNGPKPSGLSNEHRLGAIEEFNQAAHHQVFGGARNGTGSVKAASNGMCQATQRYNGSNARMGTSGPQDRNVQLMSVLMENVQRAVDDFLQSFRHYTELSLSARIQPTSNFLAFMPCNAVNFVPSVANPEFTMLIGLEEVCHRIENRLVVSRGGSSPTAGPAEERSGPTINQCSKCKSHSSPFFFDLTDSADKPTCCGSCLRTMRLEQLAGTQFRRYQSILDGHKEAERQEVLSAANRKFVAEKRAAPERCDDHKCKTRSQYCPRTHQCGEATTRRAKQATDFDLKRPSNGVFPPSFPPTHLSPEQLQQCHAEWMRQAAFLQNDGLHFPAGAPPLFSNAVAAAAALAAMTATHHSAIAQSGLAHPLPGIVSAPGGFHDRQPNDAQEDDCAAALNLTTTKHVCGRGPA